MPQQINLATPVLLTQKRYLSAQALLQALILFVVVGGALAAYGLWSLNAAGRAIGETMAAQTPELASLRAAIAAGRAAGESDDKTMPQALLAAREQLKQRQSLLAELQRGLMPPGQGHSERLQLVARSIPAQVWVTQVRADASQLEVAGFTQDPAALNDWVARLSASPLLRGQQLARVKVERAASPASVAGLGAGSPSSTLAAGSGLGVPGTRVPWAFTLASALPAAAGPIAGTRP